MFKNCNLLILGLHKGHLSYRRSLQPSKENIQHFKTWNFITFFYFCGSFLPSWIRIRIPNLDTEPLTWLTPEPIRIWIQNTSFRSGIFISCYLLEKRRLGPGSGSFLPTRFRILHSLYRGAHHGGWANLCFLRNRNHPEIQLGKRPGDQIAHSSIGRVAYSQSCKGK